MEVEVGEEEEEEGERGERMKVMTEDMPLDMYCAKSPHQKDCSNKQHSYHDNHHVKVA